MKETKITICGKEVGMAYCAATENGFEEISGKSIAVFVPVFGKDDDGNDIVEEPAKATIGDFVTLAVAAIAAYCSRKGMEIPVSTEDILYEATPAERNGLLSAIVALRSEWYAVPKVVADTVSEEYGDRKGERPKNA